MKSAPHHFDVVKNSVTEFKHNSRTEHSKNLEFSSSSFSNDSKIKSSDPHNSYTRKPGLLYLFNRPIQKFLKPWFTLLTYLLVASDFSISKSSRSEIIYLPGFTYPLFLRFRDAYLDIVHKSVRNDIPKQQTVQQYVKQGVAIVHKI